MNTKPSVLVVGGAGYIGSHAARTLRKHGYGVVIYDNLCTGHGILAEGFPLVRADIADTATLKTALAGVTAVMDFAAHAYVGESVANPRKYFRNNVEAGLNLLNTSLDCGVKHFVFSSTCAVYGVPERIPIAEDNPRNPINPYGITKMIFERALEAYDQAYGLRYASLRYFNAAGADESGEIGELHDPETHLIPLALKAAAGTGPELQLFGDDYPTADGTCIRDYIHVNDLAEAHVLALEKLWDSGTSIAANLGSGQGYSVRDILRAVEKASGCRVPYRIVPRRPGDPPALVADPTFSQTLLGWRPRRGLDIIVETAWKWHQNRGGV